MQSCNWCKSWTLGTYIRWSIDVPPPTHIHSGQCMCRWARSQRRLLLANSLLPWLYSTMPRPPCCSLDPHASAELKAVLSCCLVSSTSLWKKKTHCLILRSPKRSYLPIRRIFDVNYSCAQIVPWLFSTNATIYFSLFSRFKCLLKVKHIYCIIMILYVSVHHAFLSSWAVWDREKDKVHA